jgi:hypothetical protein
MVINAGFLIKIFKVFTASGDDAFKMAIVVKQPYAYLAENLRGVFDRQKDVEIIVDRRKAERRREDKPVSFERRRFERRRRQETILEVAISPKQL